MDQELTIRTKKRTSGGSDFPLGAALKSDGVNFALFSRHASKVYLLLFDDPHGNPTEIIQLENRNRYVWSVFVYGLKAGQLYGYKVYGDFDPPRGLRFNDSKLLIDPYAKAVSGKALNENNLLLAYDPQEKDRSADSRENSRLVPKAIVVDDSFNWGSQKPIDVPLEKLIIYEVHLKGFTAHPSSKVSHPGTYTGFIEKIPYLKDLGINAIELLPIHEFYTEDFLLAKGLKNYWGYNTLSFFAPESSYGTNAYPGCQVNEFKQMVRALHKEGIEVILDVVYNHTAEGNELGPTLSFKGIDNPTYYCLSGPSQEPSRYYMNWTGCGNSINLSNPQTIRLVMDSLRYWVEIMHVDGFRFDLASVLGREDGVFKSSASFFNAVSQDPVLHRVKLIAEPWDLAGYQVGSFPIDWSEWNGHYRDTLRKFIKGDAGQVRDLATRLAGSSDLYADDGRSAYNSINFVTCHDGFTLWDLAAYNEKHNEANLEGNRDGTNDNNSWNCGVEGETDDPEINRLRIQQVKNHLCALLFAAGTPMILGGDEFLRTQRGNNNAYCQDNEISWFNWDSVNENSGIVAFFKKAAALTRRFTILQRRKFFHGLDRDVDSMPDIQWFGPNLQNPEWNNPELRTLCYQLDGGEENSELGEYLLFLIFNADYRLQAIQLPKLQGSMCWRRVVDTSLSTGEDICEAGKEVPLDPKDFYLANPRSTVVLAAL